MFAITILGLLTITLCFDSLVNSQASAETKHLYSFLTQNYGKVVLSGQTSFHYNDLVAKVGRKPLIQAFDMQNYSPHNPWNNWKPYDDGTVTNAINWYHSTKSKGIVSFHWHWFSPQGGSLSTSTFYTNNTNFDVSKAVQSSTPQNIATLRDIDAIAAQLRRLQLQKIPVLWRPLHEAGGKWFWWGAKTSSDTIKLYSIIYDKLNNHHKLNNLIWVWSTPQTQWYPGNSHVDIIGYDSYPGAYKYDCQKYIYLHLKQIVGDHKMISLTENGPIPDFNECWAQGAKWGYFLSWSDLVFSQNSDAHLMDIYHKTSIVKKLEDYEYNLRLQEKDIETV